MVSEVLVHVQLLSPLLWAYGEAEHHGGRNMWQRRLLTPGQTGVWDKEDQEQVTLFEGTSPVTYTLQQHPISS
jgi:hypothetical protein